MADEKVIIIGTEKSMVLAYILLIFLGQLGIHRFYLGRVGTGIIQLILGIVGWATIDWVLGFIPLVIL